MASRRPITDTWLLARAKLTGGRRFYGSYPGGFLERARDLLGVHPLDPVLHVCAGMVRHYPYAGFGANDCTLDLDPLAEPDYQQDVRAPWPVCPLSRRDKGTWKAVLADPPYSIEDARHYLGGAGAMQLPTPTQILRRAWEVLPVGGRCGILLYGVPRQPPNSREVALVSVVVGCGNKQRIYSVWERTA